MKGRLFIKLSYLVVSSPQKTTRLLVERPLIFIQPSVHLSLGGRLLKKFLVASQSIGDGLKLAVQAIVSSSFLFNMYGPNIVVLGIL